MLKKIADGLLVLATLGCIAGVVRGDVFVYILCFVMLVAGILFRLLVLATNLIWKLLPGDFKKTYEGKKGRFDAIIFFSALLFYIVGRVIDEICLPDGSSSIRLSVHLLGNTIAFVFAVFLAWSLIRRCKGKTIVAGSVVFILFVALLSFVSSTTLKSGKIAEVSLIEKLKSLPYIGWVPAGKDIEKTGVTQYNPELAFDGLNLYHSWLLPEAYLMDMHGNVVHKWSQKIEGGDNWRHIKMCKNGDLLVLVSDQMLIRLDWDSKIKWKKKMRFHHDFFIEEGKKTYYAIAREDKLVFWHWIPVPILSDYVVVLSPDTTIKKKIYIYDLAKELITPSRYVSIYKEVLSPRGLWRIFYFYYRTKGEYILNGNSCFDLMHTNSIEVMDKDIDGFCKKGDWLISIRDLDLVGVLDAEKQEFVWSWGSGELSRQHHPTLLKNGNVLIFDNGRIRGFSRIVELNPLTKEIVWEYKSEPPEGFYTAYKGSNQRLPNGNTLIVESDKGRVFEATRKGKIVWEFYNPEVKMENKTRGAIHRMMRIINPERYNLDKI